MPLEPTINETRRAARTCVAGLAALVLATVWATGEANAAPCRTDVANGLATTGVSSQLITVVAPSRTASSGTLRLWRKAGGCWVAASPGWRAWLGARGVSEQRREGDATTPAGTFALGSVLYGVGPNPGGLRYPYRRLGCGDWWVEDPRSPFYNRLHHLPCGVQPPFRQEGGDLSRSPTAYRHFAFIRYNADPVVRGAGSGIFLHASIGKPTHGCVSIPLGELLTVLRWLRPQSAPRIAIGTRAQLASR
jgi:L,D-peptidoglycan transpeptidase YkuD (ErfK/YbiS/YcfS/YnhG family)